MKKLLYGLTVIAVLVSCKEEAPNVDYAIISGKIENVEDGFITISRMGQSSKDTIKVSDDGVFCDTIRANLGKYLLSEGKNNTSIHLQEGNDIQVYYNSSDYTKTITISGVGAEISNYFLKKRNERNKLIGETVEFYGLEERVFKNRVIEISSTLDSIINVEENISEEFKEKEKRNIKYEYLLSLDNYQSVHSYYAKKPNFKVSDVFLEELKELDYNYEQDYVFSDDYRELVMQFYDKKAVVISARDSIPHKFAYLNVIKTVPNELIRNSLLYEYAEVEITNTLDIESFYADFMQTSTNEKHKDEITKVYDELKTVAKGQPSPKFANYENHAGGTTSLDDLKGKYVYIDVWATWCGPCLAEIPSLKKLENDYHGSNIEFVSISIDIESAYGAWKKMVAEKELGGIQLIADNAIESKFMQEYEIKSIPRFILIDPNGNIVNSNAPRPSNEKLIALFVELKI